MDKHTTQPEPRNAHLPTPALIPQPVQLEVDDKELQTKAQGKGNDLRAAVEKADANGKAAATERCTIFDAAFKAYQASPKDAARRQALVALL